MFRPLRWQRQCLSSDKLSAYCSSQVGWSCFALTRSSILVRPCFHSGLTVSEWACWRSHLVLTSKASCRSEASLSFLRQQSNRSHNLNTRNQPDLHPTYRPTLSDERRAYYAANHRSWAVHVLGCDISCRLLTRNSLRSPVVCHGRQDHRGPR